MTNKGEHVGEVLELVFRDEHGDTQMLRTSPLAGAHLARAIVDALRDAGYIDDEETDDGEEQ